MLTVYLTALLYLVLQKCSLRIRGHLTPIYQNTLASRSYYASCSFYFFICKTGLVFLITFYHLTLMIYCWFSLYLLTGVLIFFSKCYLKSPPYKDVRKQLPLSCLHLWLFELVCCQSSILTRLSLSSWHFFMCCASDHMENIDGYLMKYTNLVTGWQYRYAPLCVSHCKLKK